MTRHTYSIEIYFGGKWVHLMTEQRGYLQGWLGHHRESGGPRSACRLVRDGDGLIIEHVRGLAAVSIGMVAGFPTAEQYERAGQDALEQARLIREREAARKARRERP